ncbi:MAG: (2S)-methylsuccinyl-CoA dehydrogenase [Alphaproteobacteria bacterium MarineAlpha6_Bin6]|nr:acyl-CoA dehydrogenase [Pelagibacteraceae bacterium]PPR31749.1 MAG: (2S)-methylsuccinyl-CoA dehydrogenase [Alphaproteobacteria bacterium MarineAlpha6_Bin6]PPR33974.1 MAG: (2S)-methylsuccinyl-CoA dehydrogenase [Alphaproteobacteria bacterium MarineAlpha6_Bin5]|tara:strand:+ start:8323 stop:9999 length:1677 start_codon:yes stop_codon:yes gene_type:complete
MTDAAIDIKKKDNVLFNDLFQKCEASLKALDELIKKAEIHVKNKVSENGVFSTKLLEKEQFISHGFAWLKTYNMALREMLNWAKKLDENKKIFETEKLILQSAFSEYLSQIVGGIPMWQSEIIRAHDFGLTDQEINNFLIEDVKDLIKNGNTNEVKIQIAKLISDKNYGNIGLEDETLEMIQDQFKKFSEEQVLPNAHEWHLKDELIPMDVIKQMSELGVFGLTIPESYGGLGMKKIAMCVVTEELSRGYIGIGSIGTRAEIAAELIKLGGTEEQKKKWLPKISSGEILPTAVFSEPNTGSDLGSLKTRAVKDGDVYKITGNKTWITHGARTDLMTMMVRTNPEEKGYKGLSIILAEKERGTDENPFPTKGMSGGEIEVLGYRGMKEYEIAFDNFEAKKENLLGTEEGKGFKQLMETFESARIQTAARAVGLAQNALDIGLQYSQEREQFGKKIFDFPRVAIKLAWMAVETMIARQITYFSAREKDSDKRCDIEAGMAKLLAARVAWSNADNAVQIHGGNGYALEYPISRVLCDARVLNIFEGTAEIQAHVIAKGLLS